MIPLPPKWCRGLQPKRAQVWVHFSDIHPSKGQMAIWDHPL